MDSSERGQDTSIPKKAVAVDVSGADHDLAAALPPFARRIYVGGAGDVVVRQAGAPATSITYKSLPVGFYLVGAFVKVMQSGTTASNMVAEA